MPLEKMRKAGKICLILVICLPLAVMGTLVAFPFWNWFEGMTGIESMGHSGPAEWCFVVVYALCLLISFFAVRDKTPVQ